MTESVISLSGLSKRYGRVRALEDVRVEVPPGPVGLLGPNGAGKTTMLKLLLGLLEPSAGSARIAGHSPATRKGRLAMRKVVGYMPEGDCLLPDMSGVELVATLARITGLRREDAMTRAHEVLDYVELEEARYRRLDDYSTGMKQRLKLAQALVHDPEILLLDEPTNGLDPKGRRHMLELIEDLGRTQGKNLLLCSHLLPDVERTCDNVVVLHEGRVVEQGSVGAMTASDGLGVRVGYRGGGDAFRSGLADAGYRLEARGESELLVHVDVGGNGGGGVDADADGIFAVAAATGTAITSLETVRSSLEEVFLRAVGVGEAQAGGLPPREDG